MDNLHEIQMEIVKVLTFNPGSKFSEVNTFKISSDQFSYHLKKLLKDQLIVKDENSRYYLTYHGKLYSSHMNTESSRIEKLPKYSVLIIPTSTDKSFEDFLIHTRKNRIITIPDFVPERFVLERH